jgi:iron complex outermembrane receptor protein
MLKFKAAALLMLMSTAIFAQNTVSGSVRDGRGQSLIGASVQLEELKKVTVTDEFGRFIFTRVADGNYTLVIRYVGFADARQNVTVSGSGVTVPVVLEENATVTDEVVVTATRANEKTAITYTDVNKQTIQKQNFGQDLPFILNWTPSVVTTSDAGAGIGYTGIRIRGSDATRVNVTINGIPYNDSESQGTFWVNISDIASSAQSIQIQRGVGTSTNGAGAFGATLNLQTNTRNDEPYAKIISSAGSFGTFRTTLGFGTGLIKDKWVIDGRVGKINSDGYIDRATSDLRSYYFSVGYYAGKTMIKAIAFGGRERTYQAWYGVPRSRLNNDQEGMLATAANEGWNEEQTQHLLSSDSRTFNPYTYKDQVDNYQQDHLQLHFSQSISEALTANVSLHSTPGKGYYEEYRIDNDLEDYGIEPVVIGGSTIESTDLIRRRWLDSDFYGLTFSLNYEKSKLNWVTGGGWNRYACDHFGEIIWAEVSPVPAGFRYYYNFGDKRDLNIYSKAVYDFTDKLSAFLDLQYRRIDYKTYGIENKLNELSIKSDFNFFNPKIGLTYFINDNNHVYASASIGNREPVRDDFTDAIGSKTPESESMIDIEAGYKTKGESYLLSANVYGMYYDNQLVLTGKVNDVGSSIRTNVPKSHRIGVEVDGAVRLSRHLSINANVTLSENKIDEFNEVVYDYGLAFDEYNEVTIQHKDTDISFSPSIIAGSGVSFKPIKNIEATLLSKYVGRQFLDNTSNPDRQIDAYFVNDFRVSYTARPTFMKEISFSVLVNNVFDEVYESNGYTWAYRGGGQEYREYYYYPQAGRNFMLMLSLTF